MGLLSLRPAQATLPGLKRPIRLDRQASKLQALPGAQRVTRRSNCRVSLREELRGRSPLRPVAEVVARDFVEGIGLKQRSSRRSSLDPRAADVWTAVTVTAVPRRPRAAPRSVSFTLAFSRSSVPRGGVTEPLTHRPQHLAKSFGTSCRKTVVSVTEQQMLPRDHNTT